MATQESISSTTESTEDEPSAVERIADPDDYNLRRRLKQMHNAREAVMSRKDRALDLVRSQGVQFYEDDRDRIVADKLVDYIHELRPALRKADREDELLEETVELQDDLEDDEISIGTIERSRGRVSTDDGERYLSYEESMRVWDICNDYFEDVAGAVFEKSSPEPGDNPVDPAGRFSE